LWSYTVNVVPESPRALKNYGIALMKHGDVHGAINTFRKLRNYPGQELKGQILMLRAYGRMGRHKEGITLARAALLHYPHHPELLFLMGRHQFQLGDRSAAAETLKQLQSISVHDLEAAKYAHRLQYELNTGRPWQ
jgi:Flp pilus assembly protein TadD